MTVFDLEHLDPDSIDELRRRGEESTEADPLEVKLELNESPLPWQGALFSGALMTSLSEIPLRIAHGTDQHSMRNVFRSGLAAALGSRPGPTTYADPDSPLADPGLRSTWTPGAPSFRAAMFREGEDTSTGLFGPSHALFVNPHRTTTPPGPSSITRLVRRWMAKHLGGVDSPELCLRRVGFVLDQLIVNVSEHAVTEATPSVVSLVRVEVEAGEVPTLIVVVLDAGAGILTTLRPKLPDPPDSDPELLAALLRGELEGWGRGRGIGLSRLAGLAQESGGTLFVGVEGAKALVGAEGIRGQDLTAQAGGTVVSLTLPLQS